MKRLGVREFRDRATRYLAGEEVLAVERHGKLVGFYIPARVESEEEVRLALERLGRAVGRALEESDLDEEVLSRTLDLSKPAS